MTYSQTFETDRDPNKKTFDIHVIYEMPVEESEDDVPTSKSILNTIEAALAVEGLDPVAGQCLATDGEFTSEVWVDDDPVPFHELISAYRKEAAFLDREDAVEVYQRSDMRWDWRVFANNSNIIATSGGQGYENRGDAAAMIHSLFGPLPVAITALHGNTQPGKWTSEGKLVLDVPEVAKGEDDE